MNGSIQSSKDVASAFFADLARLLEHHSKGPFGLELVGGLIVVDKSTDEYRVVPLTFIANSDAPEEDAQYAREIFAHVVDVLSDNAENYDFRAAPSTKPD